MKNPDLPSLHVDTAPAAARSYVLDLRRMLDLHGNHRFLLPAYPELGFTTSQLGLAD